MANPFSFDIDRLDAAGIMEARERNQDRTKKRMQDIHALIVNRRLDKQFANNPTSSEAFLARSQAFQGYDPARAQQFLALGIDAKKEENRALEAKLAREQELALARAKGELVKTKTLTNNQEATNSAYLIQLWDEQQPGFWAGLLGEEKKLPELTDELHREFNGHFQDVIRDSRGQLSDQDARLLATQRLIGNFGGDSTENGDDNENGERVYRYNEDLLGKQEEVVYRDDTYYEAVKDMLPTAHGNKTIAQLRALDQKGQLNVNEKALRGYLENKKKEKEAKARAAGAVEALGRYIKENRKVYN
tara:strand:+ start:2329 stop:3240 length:912 start_codon:yes stop_codon:yes gene_type:complete